MQRLIFSLPFTLALFLGVQNTQAGPVRTANMGSPATAADSAKAAAELTPDNPAYWAMSINSDSHISGPTPNVSNPGQVGRPITGLAGELEIVKSRFTAPAQSGVANLQSLPKIDGSRWAFNVDCYRDPSDGSKPSSHTMLLSQNYGLSFVEGMHNAPLERIRLTPDAGSASLQPYPSHPNTYLSGSHNAGNKAYTLGFDQNGNALLQVYFPPSPGANAVVLYCVGQPLHFPKAVAAQPPAVIPSMPQQNVVQSPQAQDDDKVVVRVISSPEFCGPCNTLKGILSGKDDNHPGLIKRLFGNRVDYQVITDFGGRLQNNEKRFGGYPFTYISSRRHPQVMITGGGDVPAKKISDAISLMLNSN